jgi:hypothetical protein
MLIKRNTFDAWPKAGLAVSLTLMLMLAACGPVPAPATIAVISTEAASPATNTPDSQGGAGVNANPAGLQSEASPTAPGETDSSGSAGAAPSETPNPAFTLPQLVPTPEQPIVGEIPADLMAKLSDDVQKRAGVTAESMTIVRAEAVTWNDGSLGCPQPGMFYTQALVDGYWVVLQVGDVVYDYRTSGTAYFVLCEQPSIPQRPFSTAPPIVVQP